MKQQGDCISERDKNSKRLQSEKLDYLTQLAGEAIISVDTN
jgi:hypothetical protein